MGDRKCVRRKAKKYGFPSIPGVRRGQKTTLYLYEGLPTEWQKQIDLQEAKAKLREHGVEIKAEDEFDQLTVENKALTYADAPEFNRRILDKKASILHKSEGLTGYELKLWVKSWNTANPDKKTSVNTIMRYRKAVRDFGNNALLGKYGKRKGASKVSSEAFEKFKAFYMIEGGSSANNCWDMVTGSLCTPETIDSFPKVEAFVRRLRREVGESAIYLAREGHQKWNRKHAGYIERDYDKISAGEVWVSDHAQVDIAAASSKNGKPVFGWITSFICMKTSRTLSCFFHEESPNSDHIFQAFYLAAKTYGLPKFIYIDNGKDYRCRDFAGGRKHYRVEIDEDRARGMLLDLDITPVFALPYGAQSKTIERWHLKIKNMLSRNTVGFRGGNVTERPEKLAKEIKQEKILKFDVLNDLLQDFVFNYLNILRSKGKGTKGKSPNDAWNLENPVMRVVSREALRLFCSRTTKTLTIGRNGVNHSQYKVTYFAEWMVPLKGTKVYLRIAPDNVNDAWVFSDESDEYLGNAQIKGLIHPIAESEIDRAELREAITEKNRQLKVTKQLGLTTHVPDVAERINAMKAGAALRNTNPVSEPEQQIQQILPNSSMQQAVAARKRAEDEGKSDMSKMVLYSDIKATRYELDETRGEILLFESDRPAKEERIQELELRLQQLEALAQ
ncbi:Mu transposase C-terminal domain-containing protein [Candidatus Pacearchaeota archaeon]|nr:Mu transposase C-terminal domain-containing protein [Candidatus Pacearchaeota archaeon]